MVQIIAWIVMISFLIFVLVVIPYKARKSEKWEKILYYLAGDWDRLQKMSPDYKPTYKKLPPEELKKQFFDWYINLPKSHEDDNPNCGECRDCMDGTLGLAEIIKREEDRSRLEKESYE